MWFQNTGVQSQAGESYSKHTPEWSKTQTALSYTHHTTPAATDD